jgi:hypothetical protein
VFGALSDSDPRARVRAELRGGLPMISCFAEKVSAVSQGEHRSSHTVSHDMELYKTLLWDMSDTLRSTWSSADPEELRKVLFSHHCECLALSHLGNDVRDLLDTRLKEIAGYIGAFALDYENTVQRYAFYDGLMHLAVVDRGAVIQARTIEGDTGIPLEGAEDYHPGGLVWKPYFWDETDEAPRLPETEIESERGRRSLSLLEEKRESSVERRVFEELVARSWSDLSGATYEFEAVENTHDVLQAIMPDGKFTKYLFDTGHPVGAGKAKFFIEILRIDSEDWRFLAAQFYEGLLRARPRNLEIKKWREGYGAKFDVAVRVKSRTGETGLVRTCWILRPNELPNLITAYPEEPGTEAIDPGVQPIVPPGTDGDDFWRSVYELAHAEGIRAHRQTVPTPLFIQGYEAMPEGECGNASVTVKDARRGFARWLLKNSLGRKGYRGGATVSCMIPSQSYDRALAYAKAFAQVLVLNGVPATVDSNKT